MPSAIGQPYRLRRLLVHDDKVPATKDTISNVKINFFIVILLS